MSRALHPQYTTQTQQTADAKPRRAPRENLDGLTAEERVQRRKERARLYSNVARERYEQLQRELEGDVAAMRMFQALVEEAPQMVAVLSMDVHCLVLYANAAFKHQLVRPAVSLLGRWVCLRLCGHACLHRCEAHTHAYTYARVLHVSAHIRTCTHSLTA